MRLMLGKAACEAHVEKAACRLMLGKAACKADAGEGCMQGSCWARLCVRGSCGEGSMQADVALSGLILTHPLEDIECRKLTSNIDDELDGPQCSGVGSNPRMLLPCKC